MRSILIFLYINAFSEICLTNYVLYEVTAFNPHERAFLYDLQLKNPSIVFMNGVSNEAALPMDVIVKSDIAPMFEVRLLTIGIQFIHVSEITSEQLYKEATVKYSTNISNSFTDWEDILKWVTIQKKKNVLKKIVIAKTYEKRDIFFLRMLNNKKHPTVVIVGGEDGKDWISSAVILNFINDLLEVTNGLDMLSNNFNFYFLPIFNPDGYVYTKKEDRLWSKNRRSIDTKTKCENGNAPVGVNIARNWFLQKSAKLYGEECNSIYIGPQPLSEEESQSLSYVLRNLALEMIAFINVRGFGQYITVPYAEAYKESNNHNIIMEVLKSTCSKVRKKHDIYLHLAKTSSYFYNFTGNMADWVKDKFNTPLVYTVYLEDVNTVLPLPKSIKSITKLFITILEESLLLNKNIYGPLFNNQAQLVTNLLLVVTFSKLKLFYLDHE